MCSGSCPRLHTLCKIYSAVHTNWQLSNLSLLSIWLCSYYSVNTRRFLETIVDAGNPCRLRCIKLHRNFSCTFVRYCPCGYHSANELLSVCLKWWILLMCQINITVTFSLHIFACLFPLLAHFQELVISFSHCCVGNYIVISSGKMVVFLYQEITFL